MRESVFCTEVVRSIRAQAGWAYKVPDMPQSMLRGSRFNLPKAVDILACYEGRLYAIECKQIKKYEAFGLKNVRPSQAETLDSVGRAGGQAFVFLNVRIAHAVNRLYIFKWQHLKDLGSSIKKNELELLPSIGGRIGYFPLGEFFTHGWNTAYDGVSLP